VQAIRRHSGSAVLGFLGAFLLHHAQANQSLNPPHLLARVTGPFMNRNFNITVLVGLLCLSTLFTAVFSFFFVRWNTTARRLNAEATTISQRYAIFRNVLNDALIYSQQNPEIDPLLQSIGAKPRPDNSAR
jgi:hypothetical protein